MAAREGVAEADAEEEEEEEEEVEDSRMAFSAKLHLFFTPVSEESRRRAEL